MSIEPLETAEAHTTPNVRQISTFLDNRVGQLHRLTRAFEGTNVHILAVTVVSLVDCAIVRLLVDNTDEALRILRRAGFQVGISEVVVVELPHGSTGLLTVCSALLSAEINIHYAYPLVTRPDGRPALALLVEDAENAANVLRAMKFTVLDESDLEQL